MDSSGKLPQREQKRMMTFEASEGHLDQQGKMQVAHYRLPSHLSFLLSFDGRYGRVEEDVNLRIDVGFRFLVNNLKLRGIKDFGGMM